MHILNKFLLFLYIIIFCNIIPSLQLLSFGILSHVKNDNYTSSINDRIDVHSVNKLNKNRRKSEIKCDEYSDDVEQKIWMLHPSQSKPFSISVPCKPAINFLIVGGEPASPAEFSHMAAIGWRLHNDDTFRYLCGGSLISERWVLTAAHCAQHPEIGKPSVVRLGSNQLKDKSGEIIKIIEIIRHPEYKPSKLYSDIALLKLQKSVIFSDKIRPACLHSLSQRIPKAAWATGWGQTDENNTSNKLLKVTLDVIDNKKCSLAYENEVRLPNGVIQSMLCAGGTHSKEGKDTCKGDSGGPLQILHHRNCLYELIGITSFGKVCGVPGIPGVYTRIAYYIDWIESIVWP